MTVFEFTGTGGGPRHLHHEQDEWIYVIRGEIDIEIGNERRHLSAGESAFLPRKVAHGWASAEGRPSRIINVYQPAGRMDVSGDYGFLLPAYVLSDFMGVLRRAVALLGRWFRKSCGSIAQAGRRNKHQQVACRAPNSG